MSFLFRAVHLIALGLWLGSITFFSFFTAIPIIERMKELAPELDPRYSETQPDTRLVGDALQPVFARYFPFQVACGSVALVTSLIWMTRPGAANKARVVIILVALGLAVGNLQVLAPEVGRLRDLKYSTDAATRTQAKDDFGTWHTYSLVADMATLALVFTAMILAAALPPRQPVTASGER